jgi:hypothetical protein
MYHSHWHGNPSNFNGAFLILAACLYLTDPASTFTAPAEMLPIAGTDPHSELIGHCILCILG